MSANTGKVTTVKHCEKVIPDAQAFPLAASVAPFEGWLMGLNRSTGNAVAMAAGVVNLVALGASERDHAGSSTAGAAYFKARWSTISGLIQSGGASDALLATDLAGVAWAADNQTVGRLSNLSGSNRSMVGLCLGLDGEINQSAYVLSGPVGWTLARSAHGSDSESAGTIAYAVDASASTDLGTAADPLLIPRRKLHGHISSIEIVPSADLALALTNYRVITIYKIDTLTNTVGPVVGTFSTLTQNLAKRTVTLFTLSSTSTDLDLLETDILGYASLHTASGAVIPQSIIRVNMKVG